MQNPGPGNLLSGLSLRQAAVIAGLAYLLNPVPFAEFYAMPRLFDPSGTQMVANIAAHPHLFSTAIMAYFVSLLVADGAAWVVNQLGIYFFPDAPLGFLNAFFLAELIFMVWLLGWGWRIKDPRLT